MQTYIELLATLATLAALMWAMMKFMLRDIHYDLQEIKKISEKHEFRFEKMDSRIDHLYEENNRLYKTLIEIVQKK